MKKRGRQGEGGGRKLTVFSEEQTKEFETLSAVLNRQQIADYFGIGLTTLHEVEKRQPEVSEAYKRGKAKAIASVASGLIKQARAGNISAAMFYLKTQGGWRETSHMDLTSSDGSMSPPTVIEIVSVKPDPNKNYD